MKLILAFALALAFVAGGVFIYTKIIVPSGDQGLAPSEKSPIHKIDIKSVKEEKKSQGAKKPQPEKNSKEKDYSEFDYTDDKDRYKARKKAAKALDNEHKKTQEFLDKHDSKAQKKENRAKAISKWLDK